MLLKQSDPRWQQLCISFFAKTKASKTILKEDLAELVSDIGDIIDQRHFNWSRDAERLLHEAEKEAHDAISYIKAVSSPSVASAVILIAELMQRGSLSMAHFLEKGSYSDLPWENTLYLTPYNIRSRGGNLRMAFDRRQDAMRANATILQDGIFDKIKTNFF